jgi:hypothetical protein
VLADISLLMVCATLDTLKSGVVDEAHEVGMRMVGMMDKRLVAVVALVTLLPVRIFVGSVQADSVAMNIVASSGAISDTHR